MHTYHVYKLHTRRHNLHCLIDRDTDTAYSILHRWDTAIVQLKHVHPTVTPDTNTHTHTHPHTLTHTHTHNTTHTHTHTHTPFKPLGFLMSLLFLKLFANVQYVSIVQLFSRINKLSIQFNSQVHKCQWSDPTLLSRLNLKQITRIMYISYTHEDTIYTVL